MRIAATADFHGRGLPDVPPCDLLLIAGDWSPVDENLHRWLANVPAGEIVAVAGNHDWVAQENPDAVRELPWIYLQDETVVLDGLTIHGAPWSNQFFDWAFMGDDDELDEYWQRIPQDTNILVTHGPPHGWGDLVARGENVGSKSLSRKVASLPELKLHVFGHIHEDAGVWMSEDGGPVRANCSFVNMNYQPAHPALLFDYDGNRVVPVAGDEVIDGRARPGRERRE